MTEAMYFGIALVVLVVATGVGAYVVASGRAACDDPTVAIGSIVLLFAALLWPVAVPTAVVGYTAWALGARANRKRKEAERREREAEESVEGRRFAMTATEYAAGELDTHGRRYGPTMQTKLARCWQAGFDGQDFPYTMRWEAYREGKLAREIEKARSA